MKSEKKNILAENKSQIINFISYPPANNVPEDQTRQLIKYITYTISRIKCWFFTREENSKSVITESCTFLGILNMY